MRNKVKYCDFCGERLEPNDTFCKNCGNVGIKDKDAPDAIIEDPKGITNHISNTSNNIAIVLLTLLAIVIVILLVF